MTTSVPVAKGVSGRIQPLITFFQTQANMRGWPFLAAWAHRISGVLLVLYVWFHIITLSALSSPARFDAKMKIFGFLLFAFLEWLLALPVIYHALNGVRLILYEIFENRRDEIVFRWVIALGAIYTLLLAIFMVIGNQAISAPFFWVYTAAAAGCVAYITIAKLRASGASVFWKLQRISGAFLLLMVPAHMLFMHLNPAMGHEAQIIVARMGNFFIKLIDFALLSGVLYHGAYGLYAMGQDYLISTKAKTSLVVFLGGATLVFAWIGLKLIVRA
jgi:succinate dehydrogenase / fumarate reductase, cytochrome b subunit